jgi:hypothetical protein
MDPIKNSAKDRTAKELYRWVLIKLLVAIYANLYSVRNARYLNTMGSAKSMK